MSQMQAAHSLVRESDNVMICSELRLANTFFSRLKGLLGSKTLPVSQGLLITPASDIHTIGMAYAIDLVLLDRNMTVVQLRSSLKPWRGHFAKSPKGLQPVKQVLELAAGQVQALGVAVGDRLEIR